MASNFSGDLQLELITTGEKAGLWGTITNNNLQILELSSTGYFTVSIAAANLTLNLDAGSALGDTTATGKNLMVEVTGTLAASRTITMPVGAERIFIVKDSTTRSNNNYTISVQNVGASAAGIIPIPVGSTCMFYTDGTSVDSMKLLTVLNKGNVTVQTGTNTPYTAVNGDVVFGETANGGGGTIAVNLPVGVAGHTVTILDSSTSGGFASFNCTVDPNGTEKIQGGVAGASIALDQNNQSVTLIYTNASKGWQKLSNNQ